MINKEQLREALFNALDNNFTGVTDEDAKLIHFAAMQMLKVIEAYEKGAGIGRLGDIIDRSKQND